MTVLLVGATAVGKSALAVRLAEHYRALGRQAEIVNADSMLVYRGMDIGTAKPARSERGDVPHHLIDVMDPRETATVAEFQGAARAAIAACQARQSVPIVVGGSALYLRAVVDEFEFPGTDPNIRARLEGELASLGPSALHARLREVDPSAAQRIEPGNGRRIVRALEVLELTGRPFAAALPGPRYALEGVVQIGLSIARPTLDARIQSRVEAMWAAGLVEEVRALEWAGLREGLTASRALGYRQVLQFLAGEITEDEARERTVTATRKFARRQESWYRRDPRIVWLAWDRPDLVAAAYAVAGPDGTGARSGMGD